jgi:hypothetical protein
MCKISPKLKLCTCAAKDPASLKHYWVLARPNNKEIVMLGEVMLPMYLDLETAQYNNRILLESLNERDCFDVALEIKNRDILQLHFTGPKQQLVYAFVFKMGKWNRAQYDPFASVDLIEKGKIKPALMQV